MYRGTMKNLPRGIQFHASADRIRAEGQRRRDEAELRSAMKAMETDDLEADTDGPFGALKRRLASFVPRIRRDRT